MMEFLCDHFLEGVDGHFAFEKTEPRFLRYFIMFLQLSNLPFL